MAKRRCMEPILTPDFAEVVQQVYGVGTERNDVQTGEEIERFCQFAISGNLRRTVK